MVASRVRRTRYAARSGLAALIFIAGTDRIAYQDLASLLVHQPGVAERARSFLLSNPFAALKTATFSLPRPLGSAIPQMPLYVSAPANADVTGSIPPLAALNRAEPEPPLPPMQMVNRAAKADRLSASVQTVRAAPIVREEKEVAENAPAPTTVVAAEPAPAAAAAGTPRAEVAGSLMQTSDPLPHSGSVSRISRLIFGSDADDLPPILFEHKAAPEPQVKLAALPADPSAGAVSVAPKGEVTGDEARPKSPAERLSLAGAERKKHEKCLADAVYFESRGESERGQVAVAQVVINRTFSGFYPGNVCGVVYQNAHRKLACQFTFACDNVPDVVNDADAWSRATRIAREMLDGKLWLAEVGKATHYHAYWVKPDWIREMRKIQRIGVHTFYRPLAWEG